MRTPLSAIGPGRDLASMPPPKPRSTYTPQRVVGSFVPKLTKKAFEKYGFSTAALITDWTAIVGADLARVSAPERLKWPRWVETGSEVAPGAEGRPGATLLLKVDGSRALDVEYRRAEIVERVNAYFGYRAVAELKVLQAPAGSLAAPSTPAGRPAARTLTTPSQPPSPDIARITDDGLRAALARLHDAVTGRS